MEPISTIAAGYAADKLIEVVESAIRVHVIERWSRYRARQFFDAFCKALLDTGMSDQQLRQALDELLSDEKRSEVVFDAYRSVCLTKSRVIGPRVIALLTAELVVSQAVASSLEELIFAAAEELSDAEFAEFSEFALSQEVKAQNGIDTGTTLNPDGSLQIRMGEEMTDSNWLRDDALSFGPLDLATDVGTWATKLKRLCLVSDDVKERQWKYDEDSERYIDLPGVARQITWWLRLDKAALQLATLVRRANPKINAT